MWPRSASTAACEIGFVRAELRGPKLGSFVQVILPWVSGGRESPVSSGITLANGPKLGSFAQTISRDWVRSRKTWPRSARGLVRPVLMVTAEFSKRATGPGLASFAQKTSPEYAHPEIHGSPIAFRLCVI